MNSDSDNTIPTTVVPPDAGPVSDEAALVDAATDDGEGSHSWSWLLWGGFTGLLVVGVIWLITTDTDQYVLRPGTVTDTTDLVAVEGTEQYPPEGEIALTTVSINRGVGPVEWLNARYFDNDAELIDSERIDGDRTPDEAREENQIQMQVSQDAATVVALSYLGYELERNGAAITEVVPDAPAGPLFDPGDVIVSVDGEPVVSAEDLSVAIRGHAPGDEVVIGVRRGGQGDPVSVSVVLADRPPPEEGDEELPPELAEAGFLGVGFVDNLSMNAPFDVTIDAGRIRGPSAGLAFTLGIVDVLTPGELTGGLRVATTGTIDGAGTVGRVGGVRHKVTASRRSGYDLFLVPPSEYDEAIKFAGSLDVRCVQTVDDALLVLASVGGNVEEVIEVALTASEPIVDDTDEQVTCADVGAPDVSGSELAQAGQ